MGAKTAARMARISDLSMSHQSHVHQIEVVNRDEEARRLKLRLLSLRDENASLKDKLAQKDSRIGLISRQGDDVRHELNEARENAKLQEARLKKQTIELTALKTELDSLNGSMEDSSKALQEKFALNRELNRIRPEIEHLKSQLVNHQAIIAEKHDLQRQLNSLEVELENERRSKHRIQQRLDTDTTDEWKTRLGAAEKKHESEKKEWEKSKKKYESDLREAEGEREQLEDRVSTMKSKLKNVQSTLKETRDELERLRVEAEFAKKAPRVVYEQHNKAVVLKSQPSRKRRVNDVSMEDISIGTPGPDEAALKRPLKKRGAEYSLLGEKSAFSVTPFLSRTKGVSDDSINVPSPINSKSNATPESIAAEEDGDDRASELPIADAQPLAKSAEEVAPDSGKPTDSKAQKPRGRPRKALDDAPTLKKNMPSSSAQKMQSFQLGSKLNKVMEESEASEQENGPMSRAKKGSDPKTKPGVFGSIGASVAEADGRKKKRKILGGGNKTLFDDDDGEAAPRPAKSHLGPGRRLKAPLGGVSNAFGGKTFSPLKRDRRGVNASFLV